MISDTRLLNWLEKSQREVYCDLKGDEEKWIVDAPDLNSGWEPNLRKAIYSAIVAERKLIRRWRAGKLK